MRLALTKQAEYAVRAMAWLSRQDMEPERRKAAEIAQATGIPPVFALRVLSLLQRQGFLDARAGQYGGYALSRHAASITLLEVIEAVEGSVSTRGCVLRDLSCGDDGYCAMHQAWSQAQAALRDTLAATTILAISAPAASVPTGDRDSIATDTPPVR